MGFFNIDFEKYRPGSSLGKPLQPQIKTEQPVSQPVSTSQISPQLQEDKGIIQKVFDALAVPSQKTEQFLTGGKTYEESLREKGFGEKSSKVLGFAGQMILDPLNIIPFAKVPRLISKIPGLAKIGTAVNKVAEIPAVKRVKDSLGTKFVRGYELPKEYNLAKSEIPTKIGMGAQQIVKRTAEQFGKAPSFFRQPIEYLKNIRRTTPSTTKFTSEVIEAIPKFLEPKGAGKNTDLIALRKTLGEETYQKVKPVISQVKEQFDNDINDLVKRKRMKANTAKTLLNQGGYYPHTDFAPQRIKEYFTRPKIGEKRTYLEKRKGFEGFTYNAPKAISKRELQQFTDNVFQDFFKEIKDKFGVKIGAGKLMPEGFTQFLSDSPRVAELKGWALPKRIAEDINASFTDPLGKFGHAVDTFNRWWKPTATSMNPAFHFMNVIGNLYNSWLGGMKDPRRFLQAVKGGFNAEEKAILQRTGILARGQFGADLVSRTFDSPEAVDANRFFGLFRKGGEILENNARGAFFLDWRNKFLKQGLSDIEANRKALGKVNEYLFDYLTGLTPFETNIMRRAFPFYTWARFNIPLQFKSIITQPEKAAVVSKINQALNKGGRPEEDQEGITIPTPFTDKNGNPIRYRPNLPIQDIFTNPQKLLSMTSPFFKEIGNLGLYAGGAQKELFDPFTGQEITNKYLPVSTQVEDIAGSRAKALLRPARTVSKLEEDLSPQAIIRQLLGGFYTASPQSAELRKVGKKNAVKAAINERIRKIYRDQNKTREEKLQEIRNLIQSK